MLNPMLQQLSSPISQMISAYRSSPQAFLNQMLSQNPRMKDVMSYVKASGGDARAAFYKRAGEMGIDAEELLSKLK